MPPHALTSSISDLFKRCTRVMGLFDSRHSSTRDLRFGQALAICRSHKRCLLADIERGELAK